MTTYRKIHGRSIQSVTTDPSESVTEGQIWYNSNSDTFKSVLVNSAWSSSSPLSTARYGVSGSGTQTAGLASGGNVGPSDTRTTTVEEYNGSGFSSGGALPTATRSAGAAGTQTATIYAGGYDTANTAEAYTYDGSSWTGIPALNTARRSLDQNMSGTTTAALIAGGFSPPRINNSEEYNGSSWSEGNNLNNARDGAAAGGIQTASIIAGGGPAMASTELYDGTSWTATVNLNTARAFVSGGGTQTAAIAFGGDAPPPTGKTETFDGTSWTETADMATARYGAAPANQPGAQSSTFAAGGYTGTAITAATEEFTSSINVITAGAWASTNSLNTGRSSLAGAGTKSAGLMYGGSTPGGTPSNTSEEYDGTSFTEGNNLLSARYTYEGTGTQTAAVTFGGSPAPLKAYTEEYDGTSWTESGDMGTGRYSVAAGGTQTAAFGAGGYSGSNRSEVEHYDGSSWTSATALPSTRRAARGSGTLTAGLCMGGYAPPGSFTNTEEYDGSSWSAGGALPTGMSDLQCCGPQTANFIFGFGPSKSALSHNYDGTAWATAPSLGTGRLSAGPSKAGSQTAALIAGGDSPSSNRIATAEEFTGETSALNVKTLTQS